MATISLTDEIFATISRSGKDVLSMRMSGLASYPEVIKRLQAVITSPLGLVTLKLRNRTQGWSQRHSLVLRGRVASEPEARQLLLF